MSEAQDKILNCPCCGGELKEVYAEANYGRVLLLDQCHGCGGVWFDKWELYFVKPGSLKTLEAVDVKGLLAPHTDKCGRNQCPKCSSELVAFNDPFLPKDASIKRCPACSGIWLNRGELGKYAGFKSALTGNLREANPSELETLKHLQKELKVSDIAKPTTLELASALDNEPPLNTKEVAKDVGFLILQSLLRLVFKF